VTFPELDRAAGPAAEAFPAYRALPREAVAGFLTAIGEAIMGLGDDLIKVAGEETSLPAARLTGERGRTVGQLGMFARLVTEGSWVDARIDRAQPSRQPLPKPDVRSMLLPVGPVAVFGASNFPLAFSTAGGDTASALAAGCPVIVKAHSAHPRTSGMVAGAIAAAAKARGIHPGVFGHLQGSHDLGAALVRHPAIRAAGFTGSLRAGRALFDAAASRPDPIPFFAELGSVNPVVLLPSALAGDTSALVSGLAGSVTLGVGQFCTNPGLVFAVDGDPARAFVAALGTAIAAVAPAPMLTPGIHAAYGKRLAAAAGAPGVTIAGKSAAPADPDGKEGAAHVLAVSGKDFLAQPLLHEEIFGPSTLVVLCKDDAELESAVRALGGQLTATVHGTPEDVARHGDLLARLRERSGRLLFGGFPTGVEVCDAMQHGGPWPASTDVRFTSVGTRAILRFVRPAAWQNAPDALLPPALRNANPLGIMRMVDGVLTREPAG
jgi:NADP-dependent aldehyde dehydrogenase